MPCDRFAMNQLYSFDEACNAHVKASQVSISLHVSRTRLFLSFLRLNQILPRFILYFAYLYNFFNNDWWMSCFSIHYCILFNTRELIYRRYANEIIFHIVYLLFGKFENESRNSFWRLLFLNVPWRSIEKSF